MTCTSPFRMKGKEGNVILLPCGNCIACRVSKNREWAARLIHEKTQWKHAIFVTLTYDDKLIPSDASIQKDVFQRFIKRVRKSHEPKRLRYFGCGEYGDLHGRPHYHAIIFGLSLKKVDQDKIRHAWPYGFVYIGTVTYQSCRYVSGYILKKITGELSKEVYGDRVPPFALMSKGLGKGFLIANIKQFNNQQSFTIDGKHFAMPRYYKNVTRFMDTFDGPANKRILDLDKQQLVSDAIRKAHEKLDEYRERNLIDEDDFEWSVAKARESEDKQRALEIQARLALKKRKL